MAEDLRRFLDDEPIQARRASAAERYARLARRHPGIATAGRVLTAVLVLATVVSLIVAGHMAKLADDRRFARTPNDRATGRDRTAKAEIAARADADRARDEAKQTRNAAARQAAGLLLDRGIEDARGGEPARALHLFVQALRTLPADDPQAAPLERVIRANLSAWAETVPALEHIWPGGCRFDRRRLYSRRRRIAMAVGKDEVQCFRTDTGRPVGPPVKIPVGLGAAMVFAPDGRSLWVASPGAGKVVEQWAIHRFDPASGRPIQPPIPSDGPVNAPRRHPGRAVPRRGGLGLHPDDRGGEADADRTRKWRTASIVVWETATGRVVRKVDVNAERRLRDRERLARRVPEPLARREIRDRLGPARGEPVRGDDLHRGRETSRPIRAGTPRRWSSDAPWRLHFQNNMRTAPGDQGRPAPPLVRHRPRRARSRRPDPLPLHALWPVGGRPIRDLPGRGPGLRHRGLAAPAVRRALRPPGMAASP